MSGCDGQYERVCKDEFASIHAKLDRLDEAIRGNGRPGITVRLDRLEQDAKRQARLLWLVVGSAITAFASVLVAWVTG
ncbi:MAG: hypothetical protein ACLFVH_14765 [Phycisphaerae bacterium]|jgi:hypothetical protein